MQLKEIWERTRLRQMDFDEFAEQVRAKIDWLNKIEHCKGNRK